MRPNVQRVANAVGGAGTLAAPPSAVCGRATTGIELGRVEEGLGLL